MHLVQAGFKIMHALQLGLQLLSLLLEAAHPLLQ